MSRRVLFAGLFHETHTFLAEPTRWDSFTVSRGDEILAKLGDESPTDGFLSTARELGWIVVPTIDARATPSGPVDDAMFERFWNEFAEHARPAFASGVDAIFLVLHGAMVTPAFPDVEGEFLARLRAWPGAADLPIFGVLDLHANVSARLCTLATGLVTYRANPHTDAKATAARATRLLARCLDLQRIPRMAWCRLPLVWAPPGTGTQADPMRALVAFADEAEASQSEIWSCNIAAGFSFADTPDTGVSVSVVFDGEPAAARRVLENAASLAWSLRNLGVVTYPPVEEVVVAIPPDPRGPILLVEPADNIGGGAPGDGTGVLRALLRHRVARSLVVINDPIAVATVHDTPIGTRRSIKIGGRGWSRDAGPVSIEATLVSRSDGRFTLEDPHSHLASMVGLHADMGPCAVLRHEHVTVLLTSRKTPPFDLGQLRSQGIEPRDFAVIGVKAAVAHRQAYDPIAAAAFYVDTPGPCSSDLRAFPFRLLRRPVYPLDPIDQPTFDFA